MKKLLLALSFCFALYVCQSGFAQTQQNQNSPKGTLYDGIVAVVGDEVILYSDLQRAIRLATNDSASLAPGGKLIGSITKENVNTLLDQLIDQRVLAARVKEAGLNLTEDELNIEIQNFLTKQGITEERFQEILAQEGETFESYKEEFKRQIETQRFIGRTIRPLVSVTDDEIKNFYLQKNAGTASSQQRKFRLRSLVIANTAENSKKEEKIKKIQADLKNGKKFETLVKEYSDDKAAAQNAGLLPPRKMSDFPKPVETNLKTAKIGDIIGPFDFAGSTFFFEFVGIDISEDNNFSQQKKELESQLLETKFQERLAEYIRSERSKIKFEKFPLDISK